MASQEGHRDVVQTLLGASAGVNIARSNVSDVYKLWRDVYELMGYGGACTVSAKINITVCLRTKMVALCSTIE